MSVAKYCEHLHVHELKIYGDKRTQYLKRPHYYVVNTYCIIFTQGTIAEYIDSVPSLCTDVRLLT